MQKVIVAIGGGEIRTRGTALIDRETVRLSNKKNPKLLFIPTASPDSERYWKRVQEYFVSLVLETCLEFPFFFAKT
jgi:dipeptidase E